MPVDEQTVKHYVARCDKCGTSSFPAFTREEAIAVAIREEDFVVTSDWNGQDYVTTILCPRCAKGYQ